MIYNMVKFIQSINTSTNITLKQSIYSDNLN
jgi:hypothetical protein